MVSICGSRTAIFMVSHPSDSPSQDQGLLRGNAFMVARDLVYLEQGAVDVYGSKHLDIQSYETVEVRTVGSSSEHLCRGIERQDGLLELDKSGVEAGQNSCRTICSNVYATC